MEQFVQEASAQALWHGLYVSSVTPLWLWAGVGLALAAAGIVGGVRLRRP